MFEKWWQLALDTYFWLENGLGGSLLHRWEEQPGYQRSWNNGKEVPKWGVAEIQKMSPSTTGRCKKTREWVLPTNGHGSQSYGFDVQVWSNLCICCPGVVELVRSNLGTSFPLFYVQVPFKFSRSLCRQLLQHGLKSRLLGEKESPEEKWVNGGVILLGGISSLVTMPGSDVVFT